ncbi:sigma-E factor regulatory protein RseB [Affinibrenneria salicis]|uniref:Sigma-E factor regulatory protein RseB n=1 Tax=Affinibrenneria salicis TaxID=2590031 RepID=A0A5J5FQX1_9GAMM|nr:sigma-E factor regulatory protein RseB [Affinibrenneria salicis]KAA8995520.1 sigma-E factor regulatory protein RseB [Affinibrenneria salicis]
MKRFWFATCLLAGSLFYSALAPAQTDTGALLQKMNSASRALSYELYFVNVSNQGIESLRYRHTLFNRHSLAQLVQLDGPRREIVQRGNSISYFDTGMEPFSLPGDHIVDALPALAYADFNYLANYYNFIPVARSRIADRLCDVIRIVPRDGSRYSYVVWLDAESGLPLRADLQGREGEVLEQYRAISLTIDQDIQTAMKSLETANLPPLLTTPRPEQTRFNWTPQWLPGGVKEVSSGRRSLPEINLAIESRMYSDGLFSFSININPTGDQPIEQQYLRTSGRRMVHTEVRDNREITIVGELPPITAKRIADNIVFGEAK